MSQYSHRAPVDVVYANQDRILETDIDKTGLPSVFFTGFPPLSIEVSRQGYEPQKTKDRKSVIT